MIHQFIFAGPKPGLSREAFQSYWVNFHAVDYAAKIPQIKQYLVATCDHISSNHNVSFFEGVAEIWLANEADQIASLQSVEFLEGARRDEPRWAAFWQTFVLDTESHVIKDADPPLREFHKIYVLLKRKPGSDLGAFQQALAGHAEVIVSNAAVQRYVIGYARKGLYGLGEPRFDAIEVWSFNTLEEARTAVTTVSQTGIETSWTSFADSRYIFTFVGKEHWIIRPGER